MKKRRMSPKGHTVVGPPVSTKPSASNVDTSKTSVSKRQQGQAVVQCISIAQQMNTGADKRSLKRGTSLLEAEEVSLAYQFLPQEATRYFMELDIDDLQAEMARYLNMENIELVMEEAAVVDIYTGAVHWAKQENFSEDALSSFITILTRMIHNVQERVSVAGSLIELERILALSTEFPKMAITSKRTYRRSQRKRSSDCDCSLEYLYHRVFTVDQAKKIADFFQMSLFQHYLVHMFTFIEVKNAVLLRQNFYVHVFHGGESPIPPLDEGMEEHRAHYVSRTASLPEEDFSISLPRTPLSEVSSEKESCVPDFVEMLLETGFGYDELKQVIREVGDEVLLSVQEDLAEKLKGERDAALAALDLALGPKPSTASHKSHHTVHSLSMAASDHDSNDVPDHGTRRLSTKRNSIRRNSVGKKSRGQRVGNSNNDNSNMRSRSNNNNAGFSGVYKTRSSGIDSNKASGFDSNKASGQDNNKASGSNKNENGDLNNDENISPNNEENSSPNNNENSSPNNEENSSPNNNENSSPNNENSSHNIGENRGTTNDQNSSPNNENRGTINSENSSPNNDENSSPNNEENSSHNNDENNGPQNDQNNGTTNDENSNPNNKSRGSTNSEHSSPNNNENRGTTNNENKGTTNSENNDSITNSENNDSTTNSENNDSITNNENSSSSTNKIIGTTTNENSCTTNNKNTGNTNNKRRGGNNEDTRMKNSIYRPLAMGEKSTSNKASNMRRSNKSSNMGSNKSSNMGSNKSSNLGNNNNKARKRSATQRWYVVGRKSRIKIYSAGSGRLSRRSSSGSILDGGKRTYPCGLSAMKRERRQRRQRKRKQQPQRKK